MNVNQQRLFILCLCSLIFAFLWLYTEIGQAQETKQPLVLEIPIQATSFPSFESVEIKTIPDIPIKFHLPHGEVKNLPILSAGIDEKGNMEVIDGVDSLTWLEQSSIPSESGNTIIAGHRDWNKELGVLVQLENMKKGEPIQIEMKSGQLITLELISVHSYPLNDIPAFVMQIEGEQRTTFITCGGRFNREKGTYENRVVAVFKPII